MPIATSVQKSLEVYRKLAEKKVAMPCFCTENLATTHAIFAAADEIGREFDIMNVPVILSFTARYPERQQLINYTPFSDPVEGFLAVRDDANRLARKGGRFENVMVFAHLDHGQPDEDTDLFELGKGFLSSVMYDCSALPLEENMARTKKFKKEHRDDYLIEAIVDEIAMSGQEALILTDPARAKMYVEETGADAIVPNVGTEHQSTYIQAKYHRDRARAIRDAIGPKLVLHGSSSLSKEVVKGVGEDGVIKLNVWTTFERTAGQLIAKDTIENLRGILTQADIDALVEQGKLGEAFKGGPPAKPSLKYLTDVHRRNEIFFPTVKEMMKEYMRLLGYASLSGITF
jgi:fructose/tagatose bisphosphate aldolase